MSSPPISASRNVFKAVRLPERTPRRVALAICLLLAGAVCLVAALDSMAHYERYYQEADHIRQYPSATPYDWTPERLIASDLALAGKALRINIADTMVGLLLIGLGLWCRGKARPPEYARIDWHTTPKPTGQLTIRFQRFQIILFGCLTLFLGGLIAVILASNSLLSARTIVVVGGNGGALLTIGFFLYRARRNAVCRLDETGVLRGDGQQFLWDDFRGVVTRIDFNPRMQRYYTWRTELAFAEGESAWVIPQHVKNTSEVFTYLGSLPRAYLKTDAPSAPEAPSSLPAAPVPEITPEPPRNPDFDGLVLKTNEPDTTMDDLDRLFRQAFALDLWHFIARGEPPNVTPYLAEFPGSLDDQPMVAAFTDTDRLQRFARENDLMPHVGTPSLLSMTPADVIPYLERLGPLGVHGIFFNPDLESQGWFIPVTQLGPIKARLEKQE